MKKKWVEAVIGLKLSAKVHYVLIDEHNQPVTTLCGEKSFLNGYWDQFYKVDCKKCLKSSVPKVVARKLKK